jgi:hypothetical protein
MVQDDVTIVSEGTEVQGVGAARSSVFATSSAFVVQDATAGLSLDVILSPSNNDDAATSSADLGAALSSGTLPLQNTASQSNFLNDPTALVTAESSASSVAASLLLLVVLAFFTL